MSSWAYIALAYTLVWGALAVYALVLAWRVRQAQSVADSLHDSQDVTET